MPNISDVAHNRILGAYNRACLLTLAGVTAAVAAMILSFRGAIELALVGLILAGLADLFDGVLARRLLRSNFEKEFGAQLDSVVDAVAFVATPVVIGLNAGISALPLLVGMALFVMAGVIRLAHFNTLSVVGADQSTHHRGLPVTYTALVLPLLFVLQSSLSKEVFLLILGLSFPLMGMLFVVNVPIRKPRGVFYVILPLLAVGLIAYWIQRFPQLSNGF
jgi:CDP-diacylglycerol---serine O-phosphatidyltransferase